VGGHRERKIRSKEVVGSVFVCVVLGVKDGVELQKQKHPPFSFVSHSNRNGMVIRRRKQHHITIPAIPENQHCPTHPALPRSRRFPDIPR